MHQSADGDALTVPQTIDDYVELLETGRPWTQANIGGDGEMLTVVGWGGVNSDGHESTPDKADKLAQCLLEPRYTFAGYNPGKNGSDKLARANHWLREHGINVPTKDHTYLYDPEYGDAEINIRWVHKEIISGANVHGRLGPFMAHLAERPLLVIGPDWLDSGFVEDGLDGDGLYIPLDVGWESLDVIESDVRRVLDNLPDDTVVTWSLGYLCKVLMWRLVPDYPDLTQIDVGACWDPYCGVENRHGYKRDTWPDAKRANLAAL